MLLLAVSHGAGLCARPVSAHPPAAAQALDALAMPGAPRRQASPPEGDGLEVFDVPPGADADARPTATSSTAVAVTGDFPPLPPNPYEDDEADLPELQTELWSHGGSYLYSPEGDRLHWPMGEETHYELLRLPETWVAPEPLTGATEFLGTGPVNVDPARRWPSPSGYHWDPRFVGYGSYGVSAFALEQNQQRQDAIGHQLIVDLDLALTATERFHMQFRPLGRRNTGGSFYQFNDPAGYENNATGEPDRYWFEAELHSLVGPVHDPFASLDYHMVFGKFPFALHNSLLMNDDIIGAVVNKNTIYLGTLSNLNVQAFVGFNDVDTYQLVESQVYGLHLSIDHRRDFYEATYAYVAADQDRGAHYLGFSRTSFYGALTLAGRLLLKQGDQGGTGSAQLIVLESNYDRYFEYSPCGFEHGVFYCNAFYASEGWNSIAGGNFNRLRTAFEVNPLVRLAAGPARQDTAGIACGVQLFRRHEDESWIPEFAFEVPGGEPVYGCGLRYLRKTGPRSFLEALGTFNFSNDPQFDREGVFTGHTWIF